MRVAGRPGHDQAGHRVRLEWGPVGGPAVARGAEVAVVVDVLSFTTTLGVALERGITVLPYRWRDETASAYAAAHDAVLAVGRLEAREQAGQVSLSPAAMERASGIERLVLPSPNGSTIAFALRDSGCTVVGASLRNAAAVGRWVAERIGDTGSVAVVPAGERWPDDTLRPAVEDLWGAGAVVAALADAGVAGLSPEARVAAGAWRVVAARLAEDLAACAGGVELAAAGFGDDVAVAARVDASTLVPVMVRDAFVSG